MSTLVRVVNEERDRELLAECDQWLRLIRVSEVDDKRHFAIEVVDDDGRVVDSTHSSHDDLPSLPMTTAGGSSTRSTRRPDHLWKSR